VRLERATNNRSTGRKTGKRKSVSAVTARFPETISLLRWAGTPISFARRYWLIPIGLRNSSIRISPGVTGLSLFD